MTITVYKTVNHTIDENKFHFVDLSIELLKVYQPELSIIKSTRNRKTVKI